MAATASGASTAPNRIPLHVIHGNEGNEENYYRSSPGQPGVYDMRNMGDETDRIKIRMKEFEDRCKRWREDFFIKQGQTSSQSNFDAASPPFNDINNNNSHNLTSSKTTSTSFGNTSAPQFASSLHRSSIEDTEHGGKKYKIEFDIGDFKQNELQISTQAKSLVIKGDREVKAGSSTETKTFNRELTVPEYVDMDKMNAFLLDKDLSNPDSSSILILEAPIIMEKYTYRRSAFDKQSNMSNSTQSPTRLIKNATQFSTNSPGHSVYPPRAPISVQATPPPPAPASRGIAVPPTASSESHHTENKTSTTSTSHTTSRTVLNNAGSFDEHYSTLNSTKAHPAYVDDYYQKSPVRTNNTNPAMVNRVNPNQLFTPELISGYPIYDNKEGCVVYKFDFGGFDQSEIHLTITVDRTLEIKATKESSDHLGKVYREFKREIQLEPEVDANLIKNLLYDGILTLKIPKPNRLDGNGSMCNNHNLHSPNGFQEFYTDDGKLAKLTSDFKGFSPENIKIVLSANNVLKISAHQSDSSVNAQSSKGTVKKECNRQFTLPSSIQPEQMRAIMSRDGVLTVDFASKPNGNSIKFDDRIHINN